MFERFSRSWQLVKASGSVLMQDKELLLFPLISSVAAFIVLMCFALPLFGFAALDGLSRGHVGGLGLYVVGLLFYLTQYFVIFFFNAALVGAAMIRLNGGNPTLGDGLSIAISKWQNILGYAAIAATVGLLLRAVQRRSGRVTIAMMLKSAAALVTAIVIVVIMFIFVALVQTALSAIYAAALYRYADGNQQTSGFDTTTLANAFVPAR